VMDPITDALAAQAPAASLLAAYALLFALAEIEIEGPHGWAEKLPTWFRVTPWYARAFRLASGGKPLTGYHATMIPLAFTSFHLGLAFGLVWTPALEASILGRFAIWVVVWDLLWFLLNPHFGWRRFRAGEVWWLSRIWIARIPLEYWCGLAVSFGLAAAALHWDPEAPAIVEHAAFATLLLAICPLGAALAPWYQRWHRHMRREGADERRHVFDKDVLDKE